MCRIATRSVLCSIFYFFYGCVQNTCLGFLSKWNRERKSPTNSLLHTWLSSLSYSVLHIVRMSWFKPVQRFIQFYFCSSQCRLFWLCLCQSRVGTRFGMLQESELLWLNWFLVCTGCLSGPGGKDLTKVVIDDKLNGTKCCFHLLFKVELSEDLCWNAFKVFSFFIW